MTALLVGVSQYQQSEIFADLPGASSDVVWLSRILAANGFTSDDVIALTGKTATKDSILNIIGTSPTHRRGNDTAFLLYLSCHASALKASNEGFSEIAFICYDTSIRHRRLSSITLSELFLALSRRIETQHISIFIDACNLSSDLLRKGVSKYMNQFENRKSVTFFISSHNSKSFEGFTSSSGEFTSALLDTVEELKDHEQRDILKLTQGVKEKLSLRGLPAPVFMSFGELPPWPLEANSRQSITEKSVVLRDAAKEAILKKMRRRSRALMCLVGSSGSGKSAIIAQLVPMLGSTLLFSLSKKEVTFSAEETLHQLTRLIQETYQALFSPLEVNIGTPECMARLLESSPQTIMIVDGGENLSEEAWDQLWTLADHHEMSVLTTAHARTLSKPALEYFDVPPLDFKEASELAHLHGVDDKTAIHTAHRQSGGHPLRFLTTLHSKDRTSVSNADQFIADCVSAAGGFVDKRVFCPVFGIDLRDIDLLLASGQIVDVDGIFLLHDSRFDETRVLSEPLSINAFHYWQMEMHGDHRLFAAEKTIKSYLSIPSTISVSPEVISTAINIAGGRISTTEISAVAMSALRRNDPHAFRASIELLSKRGNNQSVVAIVNDAKSEISAMDPATRAAVLLAKSRIAWWDGDFSSSQDAIHECISVSSNDSVMVRATLELAINKFFLGRWEETETLLKQVINSKSGSPNDVAWAKMMLGSSLGLRGLALDNALSLLDESKYLLLVQGDTAGCSIAYSNSGEVRWRNGQYVSAYNDLTQGYIVSKSSGMETNPLDYHQNFVQLLMRWKGIHSDEIEAHLSVLRQCSEESVGRMQMMQIANTLAIHALYAKDMTDAERWLSMGETLTRDSAEHRIYYTAYMAIFCVLQGREYRHLVEQSRQLILDGSNSVAAKIIRGDLIYCIARAFPSECRVALSLLGEEDGLDVYYGI